MENLKYYSQFAEDKLLDRIFKGKKNGFCVEVGANDGLNDSTTIYFEKKGWDCVLIEPNPELCSLIRATRNAILFECAASDKEGNVTLYVAEGADRSHGVSTIEGSKKSLDKIKFYGFTYKEVSVVTQELDQILGSLNFGRKIDFISIDVEGHELDVLKGFSLINWQPTIVLVEDNSNYEERNVRDYMYKHDYICFKRTGVNDWYAHKSNKDLVNNLNRFAYYCAKVIQKLKNKIRKFIF